MNTLVSIAKDALIACYAKQGGTSALILIGCMSMGISTHDLAIVAVSTPAEPHTSLRACNQGTWISRVIPEAARRMVAWLNKDIFHL